MNNDARKARIMVVEDELIIAEEIRMIIGKLGYETTSVSDSGENAVARARMDQPDAILMDINLKGRMDGIEAAGVIRKESGVPIIFLTAHADDERIGRAKRTMPYGYVLKPFRENDLKAAIATALHIAAVNRERDEVRRRLRESEARYRDLYTDRKRAEAERERLLTAIEHTGDIIVVTDADGTIQFVNRAFEAVTGYTREEAVGQNPRILKSGRQDKSFYCELWSTITGGGLFRGRMVNKRKDGTLYTEEAVITAVRDDRGRIVNYVAVKRDITEQIQLAAQFQQMQKMESIGTLAGGVAHDFNNMLYPIVGRCEMLLDDLTWDKRLRGHVQAILDSALRAAALVKQILAFSRQTQTEKQPVKVQATLREVLSMIRHSIPTTIAMNLNIDESCAPVLASAGQIHQVIMNLITNAYHAMESGEGVLEIGLGETDITIDHLPEAALPSGRYVYLYVSDTGMGIDPGVIHRIFDPFFTTKEVGKGTGLGLSVSYGIVKEHGGAIQVASRPGEGSTFHVYLPVMGRTMHVKPTPASAAHVRKGSEHILFVDDDSFIIDMVTPTLERLGYRVTARASSVDALEAFRNDPDRFDLMITDMTMPNMTGVQLADEIHKIRSGFPIILCTGFSERIDEQRARTLGIKAFLMKPIVRDQLAGVIRKVLEG